MDVNDLRIATTVISFIAFIVIMVWAFSKRNTQDFDEAAKMPFDQD
jgi:cytochrome c oxidase cbb3-type subunit IV